MRPSTLPLAGELSATRGRSRGQIRSEPPGFIRTTFRIVWVLSLTAAAIGGAIFWKASPDCAHPCRIDGSTGPIAAVSRPATAAAATAARPIKPKTVADKPRP